MIERRTMSCLVLIKSQSDLAFSKPALRKVSFVEKRIGRSYKLCNLSIIKELKDYIYIDYTNVGWWCVSLFLKLLEFGKNIQI